MLDIRYRIILAMALPLMLSGFIQSVLSMTDAHFLADYSKLAYDANGSAGLWYITMHMAFIGMADGAQILMANRIGEGDESGVAKVFQSTVLNAFFIAVILTLIVQLAIPHMVHYVVRDKALADADLSFLEIRSYAFWASVITLSIDSFYYATGKTTMVLIAAAITAVSNIFMDWVFVFGRGPIPAMGLEGAALASTLAEFLGAIFLVAVLAAGKLRRQYGLWEKIVVSYRQLRENIKVGAPLLMQGLVALSVWVVFFTWIEQMGSDELTISLNIRFVYFLAFIPIWGFASATKTYIAQYIGAGELKMVPVIQRRIQLLTVVFMFVTFHGAVFYPEALIRMVNGDPRYVEQSAFILRLVFASIIIYSLSSVFFQTVSASGKTRVTFLIECLATGCYLITAYILIKVVHAEIRYVWFVEYAYFITMGAASYLYLRFAEKPGRHVG
jgi:multidrug resistance protein, MATE family